jgi:N-methylhydantoinase A/oxoprolinase/acetone carboxylase beta subunit
MAQAARMHLIERNRDPRRFTLVAFGGAGPGHAGRVARTLGISRVVCPLAAGATSAFGCLTSPFSFEIVRSYPGLVAELQWDELNTLLQAMEAEARQALISAGIPADEVQLVRTAEMRLSRQMHRIEVPVPDGGLGPDTYEPLYRAFRETYERLYTRYSEENPLYVDLWRVVASSQPEPLPTPSVDLAAGGARKGHRLAFFPEVSGFVETPVYDRYQLAVGAELSGPAIVEEREATAIVGPYDSARIDENLNLVIQLSATKAAPRPLVSTAARKEHP